MDLRIVGGFVVLGILLVYGIALSFTSKLPKPEGSLPFFGALRIISERRTKKSLSNWLIDLHSQLGSIYEFSFFGSSSVVVADGEEVGHHVRITIHRGKSQQNAHLLIVKHSLHVLPSGEKWEKRRSVLETGLNMNQSKQAAGIAVRFVNDLVNVWKEWPVSSDEETSVDIITHIKCVAIDIFALLFFNYEFRAVQDLGNEEYDHRPPRILSTLDVMSELIGRRLGVPKSLNFLFGTGGGKEDGAPEYVKMHALNAFEFKMRERKIAKLGKAKAKAAGFVKSERNVPSSEKKVLLDYILDSKQYVDEVS
ncbi:hypothetical protein HK098_004960 [Nowakowskiella sp. JEL0407]|nr:hypothetical protein HK098_004960 [Nowakowskiella sp. JEL0407]